MHTIGESTLLQDVPGLIHLAFDRQVERTPDRVALVDGACFLTYSELQRQTRAIASALVSRGVSRGNAVAVLLPRGLEYVSAMLGIARAGGVYVPLDTSYPEDRIRYMLRASGATMVLSGRGVEPPATMASLDVDVALASTRERESSSVTPSDVAYVVFTSGTTGNPKGIAIRHASAVDLGVGHHAVCYRRYCKSAPVGCIVTPFAFDVSIEQILTLLFGHTIHVASREVARDPVRLMDFIEAGGINVLCVSPSFAVQLFAAGFDHRCRSLELVVFGGEAVGESLWRRAAADPRPFYNFYGPSEGTIDTTYCQIRAETPCETIGVALPNRRILVLDHELCECPVDVAGEIYIAGAGLAAGYVGDNQLTAERFFEHVIDGQFLRLYRTGDCGKLQADGSVRFLGRVDRQVKIRGHRIELEDVEANLRCCAGVQDAAVFVQRTPQGADRLVGYVVVDGTPVDVVQRELAARVPEYLLPNVIRSIRELPLTENGKTDYAVIARIEQAAVQVPREPPALTERRATAVADLWKELLLLDTAGDEDVFVDDGGTSMIAMQLSRAIAERLGVVVSVEDIFRLGTLGALRRHVSTLTEATA